MALATCRDCNREVSTLARHCVHCGRPRPAGTCSGSVVAGVAVVVIALALTAGVVCAARRACHKMRASAWSDSRYQEASTDCHFVRARTADKAAFIKSVEQDDMEVTEIGPGLYELRRVKPAEAEAPKAERR